MLGVSGQPGLRGETASTIPQNEIKQINKNSREAKTNLQDRNLPEAALTVSVARRRLRQEDCSKLEVSLGYRVSPGQPDL